MYRRKAPIFYNWSFSSEYIGASHPMQAYNHEEADTRILIHLQDALHNGATTCLVRSVDTDVIVIIIARFYDLLQQHTAADIWLAFDTGANFRYIHTNTLLCYCDCGKI